MGRGVQSSLGYLFGSGEAAEEHGAVSTSNDNDEPPQKSTASASCLLAVDVVTKEIPAGIQGSQANNYLRADGQNFITDRPSTKVHAAPGGGWLPVWRWWWQLMQI